VRAQREGPTLTRVLTRKVTRDCWKALAVVGALSLAGCASTVDEPAAKATVTETVTVSPAPTEPAWSIEENGGGTGAGPQFPETLDGWRLVRKWNVLERAFDHTWTDGSGPEYTPFPATMNGCATSLFLVRWRAVDDSSTVVSGWTQSGQLPQRLAPAAAGWMVLDGCQTPRWRLDDAPNGGTLTDLTVDVQEWAPAP